jgi:XTP/dITP diphosphohydrolase
MKNTLLISTTNSGKQIEMLTLLRNEIQSLCLPEDISLSLKVAETGSTYTENAMIKATAFCKASGLPALADDTGLEVDVLGGAPGLFSARFSKKPSANDADRRKLLISKLLAFKQPWKAQFVCAMVLALPDGTVFKSKGLCAGEIIPQERGDNGFGYDPIFLCADNGATMAELTMEEKNTISHRAKAVQAMLPFIQSALS